MRARALMSVMAVGVVGLMIPGCGSSTSSDQSLVRCLNGYVPAASASASITVTAASQTLSGALWLGFGQIGNGGAYTSVSSGAFAPTATGPAITTALQPAAPVTLNGSSSAYMVVAAGQAGAAGTTAPQLFVLPNYVAGALTIPTGSAAIRVVNVSLNPNPIGLYSTNAGSPTTALTAAGASVPFGYSAGANAYAVVTTAQLADLAVVDTAAPGTSLSLSATSTLNTFTFQSGAAYTLYVLGQPSNSSQPLTAIWVLDYPVS